MRTLITAIRAATLVTMAIGLATLPAAAQTSTPTGGADVKASSPRLKSLNPNGPKPGSWVDDKGRVREPDLELGTELIELGDRITATGFPPQKEVDKIAFNTGRRMVFGQKNWEAFMRDWKKAENPDDKVRVARRYADYVKAELKRTGNYGDEQAGKDDLKTSLHRLQWVEANIGGQSLSEDSVIDSLQPTADDAALGIDSLDRARIDAREDQSNAGRRAAGNAVRVAVADGIRGARNGARMATESICVAVNTVRPRVEAPRLVLRVGPSMYNY